MPDISYAKLEDVPEAFRTAAKQVDGKFVVSVVLKSQLDEFRNNNIELSRERDDLKAKVETASKLIGEDATKFAAELTELRQTAQQVKDGKLKGSDAVESEVQRRLGDVKSSYETQLRELGAQLTQAQGRVTEVTGELNRSIVDREVTNAVLAEGSGVNPAALPDILHRAYSLFKVENKQLVAKNGDAVVYGSDGVKPMTPKEWLAKVLVEAPYLGHPSAGGGATGGERTGLKGVPPAELDKMSGTEMLRRARTAGA